MSERFAKEIASKVAEWDKAGKELVPSFIANEVIAVHVQDGLARENEHTSFFRHFTYRAVRDDVGAYIAKAFGDKDDEEKKKFQLLLPGFEHLQRRYVIERNNEKVAVLIDEMTDEEIDAKEQMLMKRGRSCFAHADEFKRFKAMRKAAKAA